MAIIVEKCKRRYRVQFSISRKQHESHQQCLQKAEQLGLTIDFSRDFERWFSSQLDQLIRDLNQREDELQGVKIKMPVNESQKPVSAIAGLMEELEDGNN